MTMRRPKYDKDVHGDMAERIYESSIRAIVDPVHIGRIIAIDVDSGDYEVADSSRQASETLLARRPESQTFCRRIGPNPAVTTFGFSRTRVSP
jgi:hypothetical protein